MKLCPLSRRDKAGIITEREKYCYENLLVTPLVFPCKRSARWEEGQSWTVLTRCLCLKWNLCYSVGPCWTPHSSFPILSFSLVVTIFRFRCARTLDSVRIDLHDSDIRSSNYTAQTPLEKFQPFPHFPSLSLSLYTLSLSLQCNIRIPGSRERGAGLFPTF